ncbi:OpgC domain-containing protein, partial [Nocardioides marinus]
GAPWFGPQLDWETDSAEDYQQRLGSSAALYGQRVAYPLTDDSRFFLQRLVRQSAAQGAVPVLSLEPSLPLGELTDDHAAELAEELAALHAELGTTYLLRFAPEMNGTWYSWGQQPEAYVRAFRLLGGVVHDQTPSAAMVWSPVYGAGYPYGAAYGDVDPDREADVEALDTDGNRRLNSGDDPYGPFWPGEDAVDWVGLTLYHFGPDRGRVDNELDDPAVGGETGDVETSTGFETDVAPRPGAFRARLEEVYGYGAGGGRRPFYDRFAERYGKPLLVDTGAVWLPDPEGDPELRIKRSWWRQVLRADADRPLIGGILWVEERRREAEVRDRTVDWRATRTPRLARAFLRDLEGEVDLGPVTPPTASTPDPDPQDGLPGGSGADDMTPAPPLPGTAALPRPTAPGLAVGAGGLLLVLALSWAAGRRRPAWAYDPAVDAVAGRDARLDAARGVLLLGLVAAHVELLATTDGPVAHVMGAVVGPEAFVLVAGLAVGLQHEAVAARAGWLGAASARWAVASRWWALTVLVALVVLGLRYLPGSAAAAVTHWLPGSGGEDLYARSAPLLEYPPPWWAVRELFELRTVPWPLSMLGLLVVLSLLAPLVVAALRARLWWAVVALSWTTYAAGVLWTPDWTMGTWETAYPPLLWQVVFVHAVVLAHHRHDLAAVLARPRVRAVGAGLLGVVAAGWSAVSLWAALDGGALADRLVGLSSGRELPVVRLLLVTLTGLAAWLLLTRCWRPLAGTVAPVLTALGRRGTTVLAVHVLLLVLLAAVVAGLPG